MKVRYHRKHKCKVAFINSFTTIIVIYDGGCSRDRDGIMVVEVGLVGVVVGGGSSGSGGSSRRRK